MASIDCPRCKGPTIRGDVRSGGASLGAFFIEYDGDKRTFTGAPKPQGILQTDNRVVSFACEACGHVSSFLESAIRDRPNA